MLACVLSFLDFSLQKTHSGGLIYQLSVLGRQRVRTKEPVMRIFPFIRRMIMMLSFALLLIPAASNAQLGAKDCTAGNGLYSCDFKDDTGTQSFSAFIDLSVGQQDTTVISSDSDISFLPVDLFCACGLKGSVDDTKPL